MTESTSSSPVVSLHDISKKFGQFTALENVNLEIQRGEIFALLGPSGCGKSTLLRLIAGFETPTTGSLSIDGESMVNVAPNKRPVNMVFQSYAVFPHMSVEKNVAYGLKVEKLTGGEIKSRVEEALAQVHLTEFSHRMPHQLSGGQRQRVALARALVKKPRVLLLDEPLSALDAKLRDAMRLELVKLQQTVGVTFIIVTHDQSEALAMADRIAVLNNGRLCQVASPQLLYENPADVFVADFIGNINLFENNQLSIDADTAVISNPILGAITVPVAQLPSHNGAELTLGLRPEHLLPTLHASGKHALCGKLGDIAYQGQHSVVEVILPGGRSISAIAAADCVQQLNQLTQGATIYCDWQVEKMLLLPSAVAT